jgi:hypothetical protein
MARNDKAVRLVAALLKEGEEVIPRLSRAQSAKLRAEMIDARNWLRSRLEKKGAKRSRKAKAEQSAKASTRGRVRSGKKRQKSPMNGARPLPGHGQ